jgi:hypothetical protein
MPQQFAVMTDTGFRQVGQRMAWLLLKLYALIVLICAVGRAALLVWQHNRLQDLGAGQQLMAFVHGLRMDTMAAGFVLLPAVLLIFPKFATASSAVLTLSIWERVRD